MSSFDKFRENMGNSGPYLKAKDFEDDREVIIQPWVHNGELINFLPHYEAWVWADRKSNKKKPVHLSMEDYENDNFDPDDYDFATSTYNGKELLDKFKPTLAFLFKDIATREIKIASFNQKTLCQSLLKYIDEDSKFFIKNITSKILVIGKESETKWAAAFKDDDDGICDSFGVQLELFKFSWNDYLNGNDPFENGDSFDDVKELLGVPKKKTAAKKTAKKQEKTTKSDWTSVKTPQGKLLGDMPFAELKAMKKWFEDKKKDGPLYDACLEGIKHYSAMEGQEEVSFLEESDEDIPY